MFGWLKKNRKPADGRAHDAGGKDGWKQLMAAADAALKAGRLDQAEQSYRQALSLDSSAVEARIGLSNALIGQACYSEAKAQLNRAVLIDPANAGAYRLLGNIAQKLEDLPAAIELYREAIDLDPNLDDAYGDLTNALLASGGADAAEAMLTKAILARPQSAQLHFILGTFYARSNNWEKAEHCLNASLNINPGVYEAHSNLGSVLQQQGKFDAAIASFENAMRCSAGHVTAHSNLIWALSFQADGVGGRYLREARRFGQVVLARAQPYREWEVQPPSAGTRVLRVGFVSGDLRRHPVMTVLENVLKHLNRTKLELFAYSMNPLDDDVTGRIKGCFSHWTAIAGQSDEAVARRIYGDRVDILIDLAGHSAYNRLPVFAWKPAPVQVSWLGFLASTGVPGMDYVLADAVSTPETVRHQFTEDVWHLPQTFNCYTPPADHPKLAVMPPPAQRNGYVTFGSFQRINKLSDATLTAWGYIFKQLPHAKLWLKNDAVSHPVARDRLLMRLERAGIAASRVTFGGNLAGREDYLAAYSETDVILDTFPYPGVTTTCDALWMGVPTVTLAEGGMLGRVGASLLTCAGLSDWIARSEDAYVALAVKFGSDIDALVRLRAGIRERVAVTPLFDAAQFSLQLENALIAMWQRKMAGHGLMTGAAPGTARQEQGEVGAVIDTSAGGSADMLRLGSQALAHGDLASAFKHFFLANQSDPANADSNIALGHVLIEQGRHAQAKPYLQTATAAAPENADAHYLLGKIAQAGKDFAAAFNHLSRALDLQPDFDAAYSNLAAMYVLNREDKSLASAILNDVRHRPGHAMFHRLAGNLFDSEGALDNAVASYREALQSDTADAVAHCNLGHVMLKCGEIDAAVTHLRRAIAIQPDYFNAHSNLLWALSFGVGDDPTLYVAEARRYGQAVLRAARPFKDWKQQSAAATGRLRIGMVSADFRAHPAGFFLEGILRNINPARLELIAYSMNPQEDDVTARIKASFLKWIPIAGQDDEVVARRIHADGVDILIDLSGHSAGNRLPVFAWRPAPLQVTWLGYLASTGVPGIDYVLVDPVSTPETARSQFTEQVWHLPETLFCFTPPAAHPKTSVTPPPALRNGYVTLGSFQRLNKLSDDTLRLWGRIMSALPQARLWLRNEAVSTKHMHERLLLRLDQAGIASTRVTFGSYCPAWEDYLTAYRDVDLMLDTSPHPGVTTTCEALWMGVPTVTLAKGTTLGRIGASLLTCAGLSEWVAWSDDEYVSLAVKHGSDMGELARLRVVLRQQVAATPLFDAARFALQLEDALFSMWGRRVACLAG